MFPSPSSLRLWFPGLLGRSLKRREANRSRHQSHHLWRQLLPASRTGFWLSTTEENPAGRKLRPKKKEEEFSANLSKKTQRKKIPFLATRFASLPFRRWQSAITSRNSNAWLCSKAKISTCHRSPFWPAFRSRWPKSTSRCSRTKPSSSTAKPSCVGPPKKTLLYP